MLTGWRMGTPEAHPINTPTFSEPADVRRDQPLHATLSLSPMVPDPWVGRRLGKYEITARLGAGGMGVVYEARDTLLERDVAVKLLAGANAGPGARERFLTEARAAARLSHPNAVALFEADEADGTFYLVMELVRGRSAQQRVEADGPFPWREATRVVAEVCRGLAAAHAAGLIHRDIKPANILLATDGTAKLSDFGLAKSADGGGVGLTRSGHVVGTPRYMSPEQCQCEPADARSDVYALGGTYFTLLTGRPPYRDEGHVEVMFAHCHAPVPSARSLHPDVPEVCDAVLARALAKHRSERYQTAADLLADLETILALPDSFAPAHPGCHLANTPHDLPSPGAMTPLGDSSASVARLPEEISTVPNPRRQIAKQGRGGLIPWTRYAALFVSVWLVGGAGFYLLPGWFTGEQPEVSAGQTVDGRDAATEPGGRVVNQLPRAEGPNAPAPLVRQPRGADNGNPAPAPAAVVPAGQNPPAAPLAIGGAPLVAPGTRHTQPAEDEIQKAVRTALEKSQQGQNAGPRDFHSSLKEIEKAKDMILQLNPNGAGGPK